MSDVRLDNAISDLNAVYSDANDDKSILTGVNNAISNLKNQAAAVRNAPVNGQHRPQM
ncbi:MAG: hypothetical protein IJP84_09010 [Lachnospiraceae bacterium]|nr:hypothetical protein [Lachnospiraceae bacterium]